MVKGETFLRKLNLQNMYISEKILFTVFQIVEEKRTSS